MTIAREITREITVAHTPKEFERWVANAEPGAVCEYHRGASCQFEAAREKVGQKGLLASRTWKRVPTAEMAWDLGPAVITAADPHKPQARLCGLGVVELVQRRNGEGDYSFLAIKRRFRAV